ncbi:proline--tRNA ligase [Patescibacteria group bacterium]|nr:proline--tRNA ligase [Patescibacteria group bacterium]MBU2081281.1 proline--tRNA ligase [Patescibacteria group bacterium]MBU2214655.1 proline--tRNA ligase [Patescibacteria group bacterium]MBU2250335.1 proline--tRNA ligase [Patescibacteria group bacterium]
MKYSKLFGKTNKTAPEDEKIISNKLLYQAGFIRESTAGRYFFLPLGQIVQRKIMQVIKEEMDQTGSQEMVSPILHPLTLWQETNRDKSAGFELMKIEDRRGSEFALGGTAEEMFIDVVRKFQISYRDLPFNIYQFSTKFRDELRARGGLLRVREFIMKDAYSFHVDEEDFKKEYQLMSDTYTKIFKRLGLNTYIVESDNGYIGGDYCHEFVVESSVGESRFLMTEDGSYSAHEDVAIFTKEEMNLDELLQSLKKVEAKRNNDMEAGANFHKKPLWQQIKDVMFVDEKNRFILAIIRGDYDVNEMKLKHIIKAEELRHASDEEIREIIHSEPGFISPVGIKQIISKDCELIIVADDSIRKIHNAYGGANEKYFDYLNINIDRDYQPDIESDIAMTQSGYSVENNKKLVEKRGIEVGNIFQLGYYYSNKMKDATFVDKNGKSQPYYMGCYGIGIGRTMAAVVEIHHDDKGIIWPEEIAPYKIHLLTLGKDLEVLKQAEMVYDKLCKENIEVLFDDRRDIMAGEKFADADLLGIPYRIVVSTKTLKLGGVEIKQRNSQEQKIIKMDQLIKLFY